MLISRYNGITRNLCQVQATTLHKSVFKLRTALEDSKTTYCHGEDTPIHGTGQGSCASPAIWLLLSSFLMSLLQKEGHGMEMKDVNNINNLVQEIIEGFVDDMSIFTNDIENNIKKLLDKLQSDGNKWMELLQASGGMLEFLKRFYYLLTWHWDAKGNPIADDIETQQQMLNSKVLLLDNANNPLTQKESYDSHKTLGTYKCLVGLEHDHIQFLTNKSDKLH
jgi:hypothetical protein